MKKAVYLLLILSVVSCTKHVAERSENKQDAQLASLLSVALDSAIGEYIDSLYLPYAVAQIVHKDEVIYENVFYNKQITDSTAINKNSLFRLASQTKAITVVGLMMLWEKGEFDLDDRVEQYIPAFAASETTKEITIKHLLTHTSGICYDGKWEEEYKRIGALAHNSSQELSLEDNANLMAQLPLMHPAGEAFTYANNTDIIGRLIEVLSGEEYVQYITEHILEPLEMSNTMFYLDSIQKQRLVPLYSVTADGIKLKKEDAHLYDAGTYPSPSAGLVSTISDYSHFCQMILNEGTYKQKELLKPTTIQLMRENQVGKMRGEIGFGLAWDVFFPKAEAQDTAQYNRLTANGHLHPACVRWGGMYGTDYVIDFDNQLILQIYTNCRPNQSGHNHKTMFLETAYQVIEKSGIASK